MDRSQCLLGRSSSSPQRAPLPPWLGGSSGAVLRELSTSSVGSVCHRSNAPTARRESLSPSLVRTSATRHASRGSVGVCSIHGSCHSAAGSNGQAWVNPDQAALSAKVQSVLNKLDTLLVTAGKRRSPRPQPVAGGSVKADFADLLDRLAQLDMLLDDLVAMGHAFLGQPLDVTNAVTHNGTSVRDTAWSSLEQSRQQHVGMPGVPVPFVVRHHSVGNASVRSATPRLPSSICPQHRTIFVEVPQPQSTLGGGGAAPAGRGMVPPLGLPKPLGINTPGGHSPVPTGMGSPSVPPPLIPLSTTTGGADRWRSASPPPNNGWQVGGRPPVREAGRSLPTLFGVSVPLGGNGDGRLSPTTSAPARAFSRPRGNDSLLGTSPSGLAVPPLGLIGVPGIPQTGPPPRLWMPSLPLSLSDVPAPAGAESKIREWLKTIPIGNGADRGWDDSQIREIAAFAQDKQLEDASAEEIYKRFVEHQVEMAEAADT